MTVELQPYALVMVAVLPQPRDLQIARLLGWYRIPLKSAPKVVDVDYLAFYQPGSFPLPEGGRINYLAQVMGHELTTRGELFREDCPPSRRNEEYYKLLLGPLLPLSSPLAAGHWKRVTFFYTTGEYFYNAKTMHDLVVNSEDRSMLWQSLRERLSGSVDASLYDATVPELDPQLAQWLGYLYLNDKMERAGGGDDTPD